MSLIRRRMRRHKYSTLKSEEDSRLKLKVVTVPIALKKNKEEEQ